MVFILRIILAILLASVIGRSFFENHMMVIKVGLLAGVMLVFAYLFEYTKKRDRGNKNGS